MTKRRLLFGIYIIIVRSGTAVKKNRSPDLFCLKNHGKLTKNETKRDPKCVFPACLACFFLLALLCACAAPEAALPEPPAAQVQSPEEPPAPVEPPVEPIIEEEPEPALLLSEPVWLLGRLTELYQADETQWAALADVLEAAKTLNADAQLEGLETVQFQGREYIPLAETAQRLGLEWGEPGRASLSGTAADRRPDPRGWNVPVLMYHAVGDEIWGYSDLFVSEAGMEEQLQYLQENGYEPIWLLRPCAHRRL